MKKFAELVIKNRIIIIVITFVITAFFSTQISKLKVNPDVISYLPKNDSVTKLFDEIGLSYQGNTVAVIGYQSVNIFSETALNEIKAITDTLRYFKGLSSVNSIINVIDIREVDSILQVLPLIDENNIPTTLKELDSLKNYVLSKDIYKGMLVSEDASSTLITARIAHDFSIKPDSLIKKDSIELYYQKLYPKPIYEVKYNSVNDSVYISVNKTNVANAIRDKITSMSLKGNLYFGGLPYMTSDIGKIIAHDIVLLGILAFIIILLVLYFSFKSWRGVVMPILAVGIAIIWVLGLMALLGFEITMVTNAAPVVILATGSAYTIHVINRIIITIYYEQGELKDIMIKALTYIIIPVFFAAVTTIIGFISFIFGSYLVMISHFGIFTALGVLFSFVIAITFVPAFLSYFPFKNIEIKQKERTNSPLNMFLSKVFEFTFNHKKYILTTWIILIVLFGLGILKIERRVDLMDYFKENYPSKKTENFLRQTFGGTSYLYVNFKSDIQSLRTLHLMDSIQNLIKRIPSVTHTLSVIDILKEMNAVMGEGKTIPNKQE